MFRSVLFAVAAVAAMCATASAATRAESYLKQPDSWFKTAEARTVAGNILSYQSDYGGWPKNVDTTSEPHTGSRLDLQPTFDNGATIGELEFLARLFKATKDEQYRAAFERGLDYVFVAQYPTGGWPQSYPPDEFYHRYITFNDNAMSRIMEFLRDVFSEDTYEFLPKPRREIARDSFRRGIECILKCQVEVKGKLTVWCAQHDEETYQPRGARSFEVTSLSGNESVGLTRLLMSLDKPGEQAVRAVEAAVAWFKEVEQKGRWARFYEIGTNRPVFSDRDGVVKYSIDEIGDERRKGYAWLGNWPAKLLEEDYPKWKAAGRKGATAASAPLLPKIRIGLAGGMSMTDRESWAFGFKKALAGSALFFDFAAPGKDDARNPRSASRDEPEPPS